jgi:CRP-like cAMP-binding protein
VDTSRLKRVDLFARLSRSRLADLARLAAEVEVQAGTVLNREGDLGFELFVIEEGTAAVTRAGEHVVDLEPGQWFGEIGALAGRPRTATVTATSPMRLIVIFGPGFRDLLARVPDVAATVEAELNERLARAG